MQKSLYAKFLELRYFNGDELIEVLSPLMCKNCGLMWYEKDIDDCNCPADFDVTSDKCCNRHNMANIYQLCKSTEDHIDMVLPITGIF